MTSKAKLCLVVVAMTIAAYVLVKSYPFFALSGSQVQRESSPGHPDVQEMSLDPLFLDRSSLKQIPRYNISIKRLTWAEWSIVYNTSFHSFSSAATFSINGASPVKIPPGPVRTKGAPKRFALLCDALENCGSWASRQGAIVLVYTLSRLVQREFKIVMPLSCALSHLFTPNLVQWTPVEQEMASPKATNTIVLTDGQTVDQVMDSALNGDFNSRYSSEVIYFKANHFTTDKILGNFLYIHRQDKNESYKYWFHYAWNELMKPSPFLTSELKHILGESFLIRKRLLPPSENPRRDSMYDVRDSRLICAHLETGPIATVREGQNFQILGMDDLDVLQKFMTSNDPDGTGYFFVATDNINIHRQARNFFGVRFIDYGGKMMYRHYLERAPTPCDEQTEAVIDQMILSMCDVLVVGSGQLGRKAFLMKNLTESGFVLDKGGIVKFDGAPS